jgi:integrase/recombinase XerD
VPLLPDGVSILMSYLKQWRRHIPARGLWVYSDGHVVNERTLRLALADIRRQIGVKSRFTAHTMRRTYITTLQRSGLDVTTITKIAGHKSYQTTLDHYLEIHPEDLVGAVARSGARLIERGAYADKINAASTNVLEFLKHRPPERP